jgi:hypothetical protein
MTGEPELLAQIHTVSAALADLGVRVLTARDGPAIEVTMAPLHEAFDALVHAAVRVVEEEPRAGR